MQFQFNQAVAEPGLLLGSFRIDTYVVSLSCSNYSSSSVYTREAVSSSAKATFIYLLTVMVMYTIPEHPRTIIIIIKTKSPVPP